VARKLMNLVPKARFAIAHGQMREKDLEETLIRFVRREIDVLVCTTSRNRAWISRRLTPFSLMRRTVSDLSTGGRVIRRECLCLPGATRRPADPWRKRLRALMDFTRSEQTTGPSRSQDQRRGQHPRLRPVRAHHSHRL
jgi:hypothetical protein